MKTITYNRLNKLCHYLGHCDNFIFLDTSKPDQRNTSSLLFVDPIQRLQYYEGESEIEFLNTVQGLKKEGNYIAGWFSYEFGYLLESSLKGRLKRKEDQGGLLADLGVFKDCYKFDHVTGETDFPLQDIQESELEDFELTELRLSQSREEYLQAVRTILDYISAGDTYQVNYTLKLFFDFVGSPERFYADLRRNQSVSYGAYIRWQDQRIMSFSPELFFWKKDTDVMVRPMKGTLTRGRNLAEDNVNRRYLKTDVKNKSENVMIVDLLRNDLGRLMHHIVDGDVQVDSLFDVETYETLFQMTSTITGSTDKHVLADVSLYNFFKAIFPCGSVTGAPKIRTMEIIDELEGGRRGVYTGAIGYMAPNGEAVFNVPIRTVVLDGSKGEMGIGSGIVHDSDPEKEWQECLLKGRFLTNPQKIFSLIETILWHPKHGFWLLKEHIQRLEDSAKYFLFCIDIKKIERDLLRLEEEFNNSAMRVRLVVEKDGSFVINGTVIEEPKNFTLPVRLVQDLSDLPKIGFYQEPIDADSCWFYHKTTNRDLYNAAYSEALSQGLFDVLFYNQKGNVTEGCISNIIICVNGCYYTPPLSDGLLPGVMRQYLHDNSSHPIKERNLKVKDIKEADAVFLCNSVRGVVQVSLQNSQ